MKGAFVLQLCVWGLVACNGRPDEMDSGSGDDTVQSEHWNSGEVELCEVEREDPFTVYAVSLDGDNLVVDVSYSGGCGSHDWQACWNGDVAESMPYQVFVSIGHNANGDSCEMEVTDTLTIGLGELADVSTPLMIHVEGQTVTYGE
jgi:hypothetical protein